MVSLIPADALEWSPAPERWTLGDLARHIALAERQIFVEILLQETLSYQGCGAEHAGTLPAILELYERRHAESLEVVRSAHLKTRVTTPGGRNLRVSTWLNLMLEHEIHHRGQIYLMLQFLNIQTPPYFGWTSEEVIECSKP